MNCENAVAASFCDATYPPATFGLPLKGEVAADSRIPQCYAVVAQVAIATVNDLNVVNVTTDYRVQQQ